MLEVKYILQSNGLDWKHITSILLDSFAIRRGKKTGLETQVRKENPYLPHIPGDMVYMVSNGAKALMSLFSAEIENFCSDVYFEKEKSQKDADFLTF